MYRNRMHKAPLAAVLAMVMLGWGVEASAQRQLGTIGPPPKHDPQRQTSAEGMPRSISLNVP